MSVCHLPVQMEAHALLSQTQEATPVTVPLATLDRPVTPTLMSAWKLLVPRTAPVKMGSIHSGVCAMLAMKDQTAPRLPAMTKVSCWFWFTP